MRVISGLARGKKLRTLDGMDVRPTTDRIKEAIFSSIHFYLPGKVFLDLFAGSGQMGIEALSRGASKAIFVDESRKSINIVNENLKSVGIMEKAEIFNVNAKTFINSYRGKVDIAFLDPPYNTGLLEDAMENILPIMSDKGIIICESPFDAALPENIGNFIEKKSSKYGKIKVTFYINKDVN